MTTRRDRLAFLLAMILLVGILAAAKLVGLVDLSWWFIAGAPILLCAAEIAIFVPAIVIGTIQHHISRLR